MSGEPADGGGVEQVGIVVPIGLQAARGLGEIEAEVKFLFGMERFEMFGLDAGDLHL